MFVKTDQNDNLVVNVGGPEASDGAVVRVGREERCAGVGESLVDVLHDDQRLADGLAVVDHHGDLLVHRVGAEEELALVVEVNLDRGPEASDGAFVGVGGEEGVAGAGEGLVDVLHDDLRLADGVAVVDEHGHRLVHRVGGEQEVALVAEILLDVLVAHAFEVERELHSGDIGARPVSEQLELACSSSSFHFLHYARGLQLMQRFDYGDADMSALDEKQRK
uniref:Uncharacterized protein n=1 Tax=Oryza meridionalis TaxID=40149 RepID=A0A0E0F084_9ORYZ